MLRRAVTPHVMETLVKVISKGLGANTRSIQIPFQRKFKYPGHHLLEIYFFSYNKVQQGAC
jgi:hypothetical protein